MADGRTPHEYTLTLDPSTRPRRCVFKGLNRSVAGLDFHGIYSLEAGALKVCSDDHGEGSPKAFDGPGRGKFTEVYEREKA